MQQGLYPLSHPLKPLKSEFPIVAFKREVDSLPAQPVMHHSSLTECCAEARRKDGSDECSETDVHLLAGKQQVTKQSHDVRSPQDLSGSSHPCPFSFSCSLTDLSLRQKRRFM